MNYKCTKYIANPDGTGICGIHETRPDVCRVFPSQNCGTDADYPALAYKGCSYNIDDQDPIEVYKKLKAEGKQAEFYKSRISIDKQIEETTKP